MAYICDCCQTIFNDEIKHLEREYIINCPIKDCNGDVIEIDDLMIPIILRLWDLGYVTSVCCSGHPFGLNYQTRIGFNKKFWEEENISFPFLPKGFTLTSNDSYVFLESDTTESTLENNNEPEKSYNEKLDIVLGNIKALNEWVIQLEV